MKTMKWMLAFLMVAGMASAKTDLEKKHDYFSKWDANSDDKLSIEEFTEMVKTQFEKQGKEGYEAEAEKRFANNDKDGDGFVSWQENVQKLIDIGQLPADALDAKPVDTVESAASTAEVPMNIQKLFKKWDADGSGGMSLEEFTAMTKFQFEKKGKEGGEEEAAKRFEFKDANGDGSLTVEEFNRSRG